MAQLPADDAVTDQRVHVFWVGSQDSVEALVRLERPARLSQGDAEVVEVTGVARIAKQCGPICVDCIIETSLSKQDIAEVVQGRREAGIRLQRGAVLGEGCIELIALGREQT